MALERAQATAEGIAFERADGLPRALLDGCFLLRIPQELDLIPGIELCRQFYRSPQDGPEETRSYRGFRELEGIYFDREHFQTEHLLADGPARRRHFPPAVTAMADRMHGLAVHVLRTVLTHLGVPEDLWPTVSGNTVEGSGIRWFAANHYRPERAQLGCAPHKDTGFVTVLYIEQDGLEVRVDGGWTPIAPVPGYFVVNFGAAFELLTQPLATPVRAILHRVQHCAPSDDADRFSFAAFVNPPADGLLYQVHADGTATVARRSEEFLREFNEKTWSDQYEDFGISGATA